jgi:hypothetical protein
MQVSSTLIAAQQAAREAQERFRAAHIAQPQGNFAATLEKTEGGTGKFSALPLKQLAPAPQSAPAAPRQSGMAPGSLLDIKV